MDDSWDLFLKDHPEFLTEEQKSIYENWLKNTSNHQVFKTFNTSGCPLCCENPSDITNMQPALCRYCFLSGGCLSIGSRGGSKERLLKELNTVVVGKPLEGPVERYHISCPDRYVKVRIIGFLPRFAKMLLPMGCNKKTKFYAPQIACNTYDLQIYPIIKETEQGLTIQLCEDNIIEDWRSYYDCKKLLPSSSIIAVGV